MLALIQAMQRKEAELNLTAKVVPPHLNPKTMKRDIDPNSIKTGSKEALEYVSWLVNPNRLFDVALTTYNFDLVTLVATQTQKDPKEYVPYLKELKAYESTDYMKFKVHHDLKDYPRALKKLAKSRDDAHFEEALLLIRKQRLYKVALDCFAGDEQRLCRVKVAFGEYLDQRGYLEEAGSMFLAGGGLEQSQDVYLRCLDVQMTFAVAAMRQLSPEEAGKVRADLVEGLLSVNRLEEAADLMDATTDFDAVLDCYVKGNCFWKAIKLCM